MKNILISSLVAISLFFCLAIFGVSEVFARGEATDLGSVYGSGSSGSINCTWSRTHSDCCTGNIFTSCSIQTSCGGSYPVQRTGYGGLNIYYYTNSCSGFSCNNPTPNVAPANYTIPYDTRRCHYISSVATWAACVDGVQSAATVNWTSVAGTSCSHSVSLLRLCGMCEPSSVNDTYPTSSAIQSAPNPDVCYKGTLEVSSINYPSIYGTEWNWTCKYATGVSSPICTASNKYEDIGLRIKDSSHPDGVIAVGVEENIVNCKSPYKIFKDGKTRCIGLTNNISHSWATNARIQTSNGAKIIIEAETYVCTGSVPAGAMPCSGDSTGLSSSLAWQYTGTSEAQCDARKCEYYYASCFGPVPGGSTPCSGDSTGLSSSLVWQYTGASEAQCDARKCEYYTPTSYSCIGSIPGGSSPCSGDWTGLPSNLAWQYTGTAEAQCDARKCEYYTPPPACSMSLLSNEASCFGNSNLINFQKCLDSRAGGYPSPLSSCYYGFDSYTDADCYYDTLPASEQNKLYISSFQPAQHIYPGFCRNSYSATEKLLTSKTIFYGAQSCSTSGTCDAWKTCVKNMAITTSNVSPNLSGAEVAACKYGFNTSAAAIQVKNNFSDGGSWSVVPAGTGGLCEDYFPWSYFINCPNP